MQKNKVFKQIKSKIKEANKIALFCHTDPDFDCLGSMYALYYALTSINKEVDMFSHDPLPATEQAFFDKKLVNVGGENVNLNKYDLLISVDLSVAKRMGDYADNFINHKNTIKLDHHNAYKENIDFATIGYLDTNISSCSEIVFDLIKFMKIKITPQIATICYAGVVADTNFFTNTKTNKNAFLSVTKFIEYGADILKVNEILTRYIPLAELNITKIFYNKIEFINKEIALSLLSFSDLKKAGAKKENCNGLSTKLISYQGINISCSIIEKEPTLFDCSFRSRKGYDVSIIASQLGGGGHKEAAGCKFNAKTQTEAKQKVLDAITNYLKNKDK